MEPAGASSTTGETNEESAETIEDGRLPFEAPGRQRNPPSDGLLPLLWNAEWSSRELVLQQTMY